MHASEKNRFQIAFTVCNLTLDAVVSDMFGVSATAIENDLLDTDTVDPNYCIYLLRSSLKKKASDIVEAIKGFNMTAGAALQIFNLNRPRFSALPKNWNPSRIPTFEQKERVRIVQGHFDDINRRIAEIDIVTSELVADYEGHIALLCTIPDIDRRLAITMAPRLKSSI